MKNKSLLTRLFILAFCFLFSAATTAQKLFLPPGFIYDEDKVPAYTLPDVLTTVNGQKITTKAAWEKQRRPEVLSLFEQNVYGRTMAGRPREMTWKVSADSLSADGKIKMRNVTIYLTNEKENGISINVSVFLPASAKQPSPVFIIPVAKAWSTKLADNLDRFKGDPELLAAHGYGLVRFDPTDVEPDSIGGYQHSIRKWYAKPGQAEERRGEWAAIGAWAWAYSRVMDYLEQDKNIDAKKVCLTGYSRFGKTAMWAGAQDPRFAIVFSGQSGTGGAVIVRRGFGETVKRINETFPYWFTPTFRDYNDNINKLPVDWHMLVALIAPRPVYFETAKQELWGDPRGTFLSAKNAGPVYQLYGMGGVGTDSMPPVNTPVGDRIGFHMREGTHDMGYTDYDWQQFFRFADRHFGRTK